MFHSIKSLSGRKEWVWWFGGIYTKLERDGWQLGVVGERERETKLGGRSVSLNESSKEVHMHTKKLNRRINIAISVAILREEMSMLNIAKTAANFLM